MRIPFHGLVLLGIKRGVCVGRGAVQLFVKGMVCVERKRVVLTGVLMGTRAGVRSAACVKRQGRNRLPNSAELQYPTNGPKIQAKFVQKCNRFKKKWQCVRLQIQPSQIQTFYLGAWVVSTHTHTPAPPHTRGIAFRRFMKHPF